MMFKYDAFYLVSKSLDSERSWRIVITKNFFYNIIVKINSLVALFSNAGSLEF